MVDEVSFLLLGETSCYYESFVVFMLLLLITCWISHRIPRRR